MKHKVYWRYFWNVNMVAINCHIIFVIYYCLSHASHKVGVHKLYNDVKNIVFYLNINN